MVETARMVYDHAGFVLCGSEMPMIKLKRDKSLTGKGHTCFSFLFVLPTPEEAWAVYFEQQALVRLEWRIHRHEPSGKDVYVLVLPCPFGDLEYNIEGQCHIGFVKQRQLGVPAVLRRRAD